MDLILKKLTLRASQILAKSYSIFLEKYFFFGFSTKRCIDLTFFHIIFSDLHQVASTFAITDILQLTLQQIKLKIAFICRFVENFFFQVMFTKYLFLLYFFKVFAKNSSKYLKYLDHAHFSNANQVKCFFKQKLIVRLMVIKALFSCWFLYL